MSVLLIIGRGDDPFCRRIQQEVERDGRTVLLLPEEGVLHGLGYAWEPLVGGDNGYVGYLDGRVALSDIGGVLCRSYGIPVSLEDFETVDGKYISAEWNALIEAWLQSFPGPVINRLRPELWYKTSLNVPDLVSLVPDMPFALPRTLITTRGDDARAFWRSIPGDLSYAPLTGVGRYPIRSECDVDKLVALTGTLPLHLIEQVEGRALDAFVVGDAVVLVDPDGGAIPAPPAVAEHCAVVGRGLGLCFSRLSLVETPRSEWFCLGLDRMPHLYHCREETQRLIARHVASALASERRRL